MKTGIRIAVAIACLVIMFVLSCSCASKESSEPVYPPVRAGESEYEAIVVYSPFETSLEEADVAARVRIGDWLGEDDTLVLSFFSAELLEVCKGDVTGSITLCQDGTSKTTQKDYSLFSYGSELFLFLKKSPEEGDNRYYILGSYTTVLYAAHADDGKEYYVDFIGLMGETAPEELQAPLSIKDHLIMYDDYYAGSVGTNTKAVFDAESFTDYIKNRSV